MLILLCSVSFASPSFIIRNGVNHTLVDSALSKVDLSDYNSWITFNNYREETDTQILDGYFRYTYTYNIKTFKTYNYKYHIEIYKDAYDSEDELVCTLKHELAHYEQMKNNKVHNFNLTEEYANKYGCGLQ